MTKIVVEAIRKIDGPLTRQALIDSMHSIRNYDSGIFPPVTYGPDRHMGGSIVQRVVVQGGKWVVLGKPIEGDKGW